MSNLREHSKRNFSILGSNPSHQEIQSGALQRIADATELMAKNHQQLVNDLDYYRERSNRATESAAAALRSNAALRGYITKLKKKI